MRQQLRQNIIGVCQRLFNQEVDVVLTRPDSQFGDFACNVALQLAKPLGKNPREVAQMIADELAQDELLQSVSVAGPGFINMFLTDEALLKLAGSHYEGGAGQTVVIETNNPNPFKAMHIGHAYNAITADTMANLLQYEGNDVHRVSYHGDVGAHVGKSMYSILEWLDGDTSKLETIAIDERNSFMSEHYARGAAAYDKDETTKQKINELAKQSFKLDDQTYKTVYEICIAWSFEEIDRIIDRLGNNRVEKRYLESQANALGVATVQDHVGTVFRESDGAVVFDGEQYGSFTNVFVASNGEGLYAARDLGLMQLKHQDFQADKSYIVTGGEQRDYFKGVIAAAEQCLPDLKGVTVNVSTGLVKLSTGKMSSRTGDVLDIHWLFEQMEEAVEARGSAADHILLGAIRYEFLKVKIGSDVVFDVGEAVSIKGNTGPYLQYAHARARSILRKSEIQSENIMNLEEDERSLVRKLGEYEQTVELAVSELLPHYVCTYLYELAQVFNRFYESNTVIGHEREAQRLQLVDMYSQTLRNGLDILNITAPEQM